MEDATIKTGDQNHRTDFRGSTGFQSDWISLKLSTVTSAALTVTNRFSSVRWVRAARASWVKASRSLIGAGGNVMENKGNFVGNYKQFGPICWCFADETSTQLKHWECWKHFNIFSLYKNFVQRIFTKLATLAAMKLIVHRCKQHRHLSRIVFAVVYRKKTKNF